MISVSIPAVCIAVRVFDSRVSYSAMEKARFGDVIILIPLLGLDVFSIRFNNLLRVIDANWVYDCRNYAKFWKK